MTVVEHLPYLMAEADLPVLSREAEPPVVVEAVRVLLQEMVGRTLSPSQSVSLPGGLSEVAAAARVPTAVPYQLAALVLGIPLAHADDPWAVAALRDWMPATCLERLRVVPLHFDGDAIHYATPDVPTAEQAERVAEVFGVRAARSLLCTPESIGVWSLPPDPSRRPARRVLETGPTGGAVWMAALRRLPLPDSLLGPLAAKVALTGSTAVVAGDPRAMDTLDPLVARLTGLPVAHAEVPLEVYQWFAAGSQTLPPPSPTELVEQVRTLSAVHRGQGWHAALSGLTGDQRVRVAAWALNRPWLSAEVAVVAAARWPRVARELLVEPECAAGPMGLEQAGERRMVVVGVSPTAGGSALAQGAYAMALLCTPLAEVLPAELAATAMSRVQAGVALDEALTEIAPDLSACALLAEYAGLPTLDLDPQPRTEVGIDALGRTCHTADWDDPVHVEWHAVLAEPDVVPVGNDPDGALLVAVCDPLAPGLPQRLGDLAAERVRVAVAPRDQVHRARTRLLARCSREAGAQRSGLSPAQRDRARLHSAQWNVSPAQAVLDLDLVAEPTAGLPPDRVVRRPEDSAHQFLTSGQMIVLAGIAAAGGAAMAYAPRHSAATLVLFVLAALVLVGAARTGEALRIRRARTLRPLEIVDESAETPVVTVLVPLDAGVPADLAHLANFDYPADRLDVLLLVEHEDTRTRAALAAATLPSFAQVLEVPPSEVSGRFKACNYGLLHARGRYVVLHDPAARPEPGLLRRAVRVFRRGPSDVVCLQAGLHHRNGAAGPFGRLLAAGYALTFGAMPALCSGRRPIPLGPTSAFFVTDWLRTAGGWDPHNRTAQADLGVRIRRLGGRVGVLEGVTDHPLESDVRGWVRRCTRCVAGYLQTYLVHMRQPRQLFDELGLRGFIGFQCAIAGTALAFVAFPVLWLLVALWALDIAAWVPGLLPGPPAVAPGLLVIAGGLFVLANVLAYPVRAGCRLLLSPWYWSVRSALVVRRLKNLQTRASTAANGSGTRSGSKASTSNVA